MAPFPEPFETLTEPQASGKDVLLALLCSAPDPETIIQQIKLISAGSWQSDSEPRCLAPASTPSARQLPGLSLQLRAPKITSPLCLACSSGYEPPGSALTVGVDPASMVMLPVSLGTVNYMKTQDALIW